MNQLNDKIKILFIPFLIIAVGCIGGYTFIHWLLFIHWNIFPIEDNILEILFPALVPIFPIYYWWQPRVNLISENEGSLVYFNASFANGNRWRKGNPRMGIQFFAILTIATSTIIAQFYLETATGKITNLENVTQISQQKATKYYSLDSCYIDKKDNGKNIYATVSGKYSDGLEYSMYLVMPIFNKATDTIQPTSNVWLGIKYGRRISNRISQVEKDEQWRKFIRDCANNLFMKNMHEFVYLERVGNNNDHDIYISALRKSCKGSGGDNIILLPINKPFEARNGHKFVWIFGSFAIGLVILFIILQYLKFDEIDLENYKKSRNKVY